VCVASDVPCRSHRNGPCLSARPTTRRQIPLLPPHRQKQRLCWNQDAFPRRVPPCSTPVRPAWLAPCLTEGNGIQQPITGPRRFHRGTGFRRLFTTRAQGRMARPKRIVGKLAARRECTPRPNAARRLLQPEQPASTTTRPPDPRRVRPMKRVQLALDWELTSERGWGPFRYIDRRLRVTPERLRRCEPCGSIATLPPVASRGYSGQRPAGSRRPTPHTIRSEATGGAFPRPDSLGHLLSRGRSGAGRNPAPPAIQPKPNGTLAIPSHKPNLVRKHETLGLRGLRTVHFRETGGLNNHHSTCLRRSCAFIQDEAPACSRTRCSGQGPPALSCPFFDKAERRPAHAFLAGSN
jgi:hypothetical protein